MYTHICNAFARVYSFLSPVNIHVSCTELYRAVHSYMQCIRACSHVYLQGICTLIYMSPKPSREDAMRICTSTVYSHICIIHSHIYTCNIYKVYTHSYICHARRRGCNVDGNRNARLDLFSTSEQFSRITRQQITQMHELCHTYD